MKPPAKKSAGVKPKATAPRPMKVVNPTNKYAIHIKHERLSNKILPLLIMYGLGAAAGAAGGVGGKILYDQHKKEIADAIADADYKRLREIDFT